MSLAVLYSRALSGMDAAQVTVEVHLANGLPSRIFNDMPVISHKINPRLGIILHHAYSARNIQAG